MTPDHKPGCEALGGYGNGVGACACTPEKQAAPSEWVERGLELAHDFRCAAPGGVFAADQALLAHLESREAEFQLLEKDIAEFREAIAIANERMDRQEALVEQLAEALELLLEEEEAGTVCNMDRRNARAALAAYQEKT